MRKQETQGGTAAKRGLKTILISAAAGLLCILILAGLLAFLMTRSKLADERTYYAVFLILAAGALLSGFLCAKKGRGRGILLGAFAALPLIAVFLLVPYFFFESSVSGILLLSAPVLLISSSVGGIIGANRR